MEKQETMIYSRVMILFTQHSGFTLSHSYTEYRPFSTHFENCLQLN